MESSMAEFVERQLACELLPTEIVIRAACLAAPKVQHRAGFSGLRILASQLYVPGKGGVLC